MQDRVSMHPGRIKLITVDKNNGIYDMERADEPLREGTPLNAANLFSGDAASAITDCSIRRKNTPIVIPDTLDAGIRMLCSYIGAVDYTNRTIWDIYDLNKGKGIFTNKRIIYLGLLNAVFISVTFKFDSGAVTEGSPVITIEAMDHQTDDIFAGCAAKVPMLSSAASNNPGPYMEYDSLNGALNISVRPLNAMSSSTPEITLVGMYHMFE